MGDFLKSFSINTIGFVAIAAGLVVIISSDPPKTICDAELQQFRIGVRGFLYPNRDVKIHKGKYFEEFDMCKQGVTPGACVGLFDGIRKMLDASSVVSERCLATVGDDADFKNVIFSTTDLMVRKAWGADAAPVSVTLKNGWLNMSDVHLFCRLKKRIDDFYGEGTWDKYKEKYFTELPGAKALTRQVVWEKSLLSSRCQ
jgi:hypothetical protein